MWRPCRIHLLFLVFLVTVITVSTQPDDIESFDQPDVVDMEEANEYVPAEPSDRSGVYFYENFDDQDIARKRWIVSRAQKEDQQSSKYEGVWVFQLPQRVIFGNDRSLVLKSKAKHAAISAKLDRPFDFKNKPLFIQYEVNFQSGMDCGGAYIKLLSQSDSLQLAKFTDKTPYTIMFGPDKCGNDYKLHFIFRHKNPITGEFEEKHAAKPTNRLEENYSDKKPHAYLLKLFPDNSFQVYVDNVLVNNGHLLEDVTPPVNPPVEIPDENDVKPKDWDERETIIDPTAKKPEDWNESIPATIPDPSAIIPSGWLEHEEPTIPDETAVKPGDWDEGMDGDWEPPKINNPVCANAVGCGEWNPPQIPNPAYKGKWKHPTIPNPDYKGKWTPGMIPNPKYFEDTEPFKMTSIGAVGIEIWAMTDLILFDNFIITDNEKALADWNSKTYDLKKRIMDKDSKTWYGKFMRKINYYRGAWLCYAIYCLVPVVAYLVYLWKLFLEEEGVFTRTFNYTNAHPWLWAVYLVVVALPLVLIITFCCSGNQEKRDDARNKKTDEYVEDYEGDLGNERQDRKEAVNVTKACKIPRAKGKEELELDVPYVEDITNVEEMFQDNGEEFEGNEEEGHESGLSEPTGGVTESESEEFAPLQDDEAQEVSPSGPKKRIPHAE